MSLFWNLISSTARLALYLEEPRLCEENLNVDGVEIAIEPCLGCFSFEFKSVFWGCCKPFDFTFCSGKDWVSFLSIKFVVLG